MNGRIVITGAPHSGKSTVTRELARRHAGRVIIVPEAATQYYTALGLRWDQLTIDQQREAQRGIYHLQVEQEGRIAEAHPGKLLVLDRGTIDGAAYWPDGPDAYWADLGTSPAEQLARYRTVIILETSAAIGIYDGQTSNNIRFEDAAGAVEAGRTLERLWAAHPKVHVVRARHQFAEKLAEVERIVLA